MSHKTPDASKHATPDRGRVGVVASLASLIAGPAAWIAQLVFGYGLSSLACFPHDAPFRQSPPPGWSSEPMVLVVASAVCLAVAVLGGLAAFVHWRRPGNDGRTRFMAACGVLSGAGFALAIGFDIPAILAVPACWSIAS